MDHRGKPFIAAAAAAALAVPGQASASDSQLWTGGAATVKLSDKWAVSQDLTARFSEHRNGLYELEANTLVGYRLNKVVAVWAGYTHDPNYSSDHLTIMEQRAREQITFDNFANVGPGRLSGRVRLEQRWRQGVSGTGWRLRPFVRYSVPFNKDGATALTVTEEPFIDINTTSFQQVNGLERLRTFVGVTTPVARHLSAEIGYLNQHGFVPGAKDTNDNVASLSLSLSL
jgi:hypothetical protein